MDALHTHLLWYEGEVTASNADKSPELNAFYERQSARIEEERARAFPGVKIVGNVNVSTIPVAEVGLLHTRITELETAQQRSIRRIAELEASKSKDATKIAELEAALAAAKGGPAGATGGGTAGGGQAQPAPSAIAVAPPATIPSLEDIIARTSDALLKLPVVDSRSHGAALLVLDDCMKGRITDMDSIIAQLYGAGFNGNIYAAADNIAECVHASVALQARAPSAKPAEQGRTAVSGGGAGPRLPPHAIEFFEGDAIWRAVITLNGIRPLKESMIHVSVPGQEGKWLYRPGNVCGKWRHFVFPVPLAPRLDTRWYEHL